MNLEKIKLKEIIEIEDSKPFRRLSNKTQVLTPDEGFLENIKNRGSHSRSVVLSAELIMSNLAEQLGLESKDDIDYKKTIIQACLLHDIGHPPFGHDGAKKIDLFFKSLGLKEGFDDNSNNLNIILAHNINVRDDVILDIIKYSHKLYPEQQNKFLPKLQKRIEEDKEYFGKLGINLNNQKQTIACQIMDEADRDSYSCDDMADYFSLFVKSDNKKMKVSELLKFINKNDEKQLILLDKLVKTVNSGSRTQVYKFFSELKQDFNENWKLTDYGLKMKDESLYAFREALVKMSFDLYIKPIREEKKHNDNMMQLDLFLNYCASGEYSQSKMYSNKILKAEQQNKKELKLQLMRDMVSEVSDTFINSWYQKSFDYSIDEITQKKHKII